MTVKHISTFSGSGIPDYVADQLGWINLATCEKDPVCIKLLRNKFPNVKNYEDIINFDGHPYTEQVDVLSGGFPCQDISISGKGNGIKGDRSSLFFQYYRLCKEIRPRLAYFENSDKITARGIEYILCSFAEIGYDVEWESFSAAEFGHDHWRKRTYFLAYPTAFRWKGTLHFIKKHVIKAYQETNALDTSRHPFLQFEERFGEPPVFGMDDGHAKRLDSINRLGICGNAMVKNIVEVTFKTLDMLIKHDFNSH